jgi:hypothetical protein
MLVATTPAAWALNANDMRGGWEINVDGRMRIYEFSIRGSGVRGVACGPCEDGSTLARIDGTLGARAMNLVITHVRDDGSTAYQDHVSARIEGDHLAVTGQSGGPGGGAFHWIMRKDPRGPLPLGNLPLAEALPQPGAPPDNVAVYGKNGQPLPPGFRAALRAGRPWSQPGPWEPVTAARLSGLWLNGTGPRKQYFIIRRIGDGLFGLVCGPCDNPYALDALTDFSIHGDTVTFNIAHEDHGIGSLPFHNQITARLTRNELRMVNIQADNAPPQPQTAGNGITLLGPLALTPAAGS